MKKFVYKAEGIKETQEVIAVCEIAASMKIAARGHKIVKGTFKEEIVPFFATA